MENCMLSLHIDKSGHLAVRGRHLSLLHNRRADRCVNSRDPAAVEVR
jgi:hypothetical protein